MKFEEQLFQHLTIVPQKKHYTIVFHNKTDDSIIYIPKMPYEYTEILNLTLHKSLVGYWKQF